MRSFVLHKLALLCLMLDDNGMEIASFSELEVIWNIRSFYDFTIKHNLFGIRNSAFAWLCFELFILKTLNKAGTQFKWPHRALIHTIDAQMTYTHSSTTITNDNICLSVLCKWIEKLCIVFTIKIFRHLIFTVYILIQSHADQIVHICMAKRVYVE